MAVADAAVAEPGEIYDDLIAITHEDGCAQWVGVTDKACALRFPDGVSEAHRAWFTNQEQKSYGADGYPWTRLGYTYDWANRRNEGRRQSEVGLSELVIRAGATVRVEDVEKTDVYCAAP